jgi:hypothetical protein
MQTIKRLTIVVIGAADTVTPEIGEAWSRARIGLEGPYPADAMENDHTFKFSAAIIDVRYEAEIMLRLTDQLEGKAIPYLFFVPWLVIDSEPGPFVLSERSEDIEEIVSALMAQGGGIRH